MNILLALTLFGIGIATVAWTRSKTGDFANPAATVVVMWAASMGLFLLRMLPYPAMPPAAAGVLALGVGSLLAGIVLARPVARRASPAEWPALRPGAWVTVYALLGIAGTIWYIWEVDRLFGLDALLHDATRIRIALARYDIPSRFLFLQFFCMIAPILAAGLAMGGTRIGRWPWALAIASAVCTWITTDRTQFFTIVLVSLFMYLLRRGRDLSFSRAVAAVTVAGIALAGNFLAVGYWTGRTPENLGFALSPPRAETAVAAARPAAAPPQAPRESAATAAPARPASAPASPPTAPQPRPTPAIPAPHVPSQGTSRLEQGTLEAPDSAAVGRPPRVVSNRYLDAALRKSTTIYLYATGSFAAFALWYPPTTPPTYGVHSVYPMARFLNRLGVLPGPMPSPILGFAKVVRRGNLAIFFNGYTFLYYPIRDFGVAGMVVYCLLIGLLAGTVYERLRLVRTSSLHLVLMAQLSAALVLSTFVNKFNNTAAWYLAFATTVPFWGSALLRAWLARRSSSVPAANAVAR